MKIKKIDTHVHFRDENERHKETIKGGLQKAKNFGILAVCDMPNTNPPRLYISDIQRRIKIAKKANLDIGYFLWAGISAKKDQIKEMIIAEKEIPEVLGIKLYAGSSTGNLGIINIEDQRMIYKELAKNNFKGVLAVHCEREDMLCPDFWNSKIPKTHSKARPPKAEIEATKDQIRFAKETSFKGSLHICHISLPETLKEIKNARKDGLEISCEITPHHFLLDENKMEGKEGLLYKVNPPLRSKEKVIELRNKLMDLFKDQVDWLWIATDYAPHTMEEKLNLPYASGIANYNLYKEFLDFLRAKGLSFEEIEKFTYRNIKKRFEEKLKFI